MTSHELQTKGGSSECGVDWSAEHQENWRRENNRSELAHK